jgi:hypothetical protein
LAKGSILINKMINAREQVDLSLMEVDCFRLASTPSCYAFIVFTIITIATFHVTRLDRLTSSLLLDDLSYFFFCSPYDSLLYLYQMTTFSVFDHLSILQVCIENPHRLPRTTTATVRYRFFMTRGIGSYLRVRWPAITEKERRFSITVLFDRLDECLALFLRPFAMMHRLHKPTTRPHIDKRPSLPQVLSIPFVFAQVRFFLIDTTKIHRFDIV